MFIWKKKWKQKTIRTEWPTFFWRLLTQRESILRSKCCTFFLEVRIFWFLCLLGQITSLLWVNDHQILWIWWTKDKKRVQFRTKSWGKTTKHWEENLETMLILQQVKYWKKVFFSYRYHIFVWNWEDIREHREILHQRYWVEIKFLGLWTVQHPTTKVQKKNK